jgi:hypothetical protein
VLLVPLFRARRFKLAQRLQQRSFANVCREADHFDDTGHFMAFLAATNQLTRGTHMLAAGLPRFADIRRDWDRFCMLKGARILLRRLEQTGRKRVRLRLPPSVEFYRSDSNYPIADVYSHVEPPLLEITTAFDQRNGNTYYSRQLSEMDNLLDQIRPLA